MLRNRARNFASPARARPDTLIDSPAARSSAQWYKSLRCTPAIKIFDARRRIIVGSSGFLAVRSCPAHRPQSSRQPPLASPVIAQTLKLGMSSTPPEELRVLDITVNPILGPLTRVGGEPGWADLVVEDPEVLRRHCMLCKTDQGGFQVCAYDGAPTYIWRHGGWRELEIPGQGSFGRWGDYVRLGVNGPALRVWPPPHPVAMHGG